MDRRKSSFFNFENCFPENIDPKAFPFDVNSFERRESFYFEAPVIERRESRHQDSFIFPRRESIASEFHAFTAIAPSSREEAIDELVRHYDLSPDTLLSLRSISKFRSSENFSNQSTKVGSMKNPSKPASLTSSSQRR